MRLDPQKTGTVAAAIWLLFVGYELRSLARKTLEWHRAQERTRVSTDRLHGGAAQLAGFIHDIQRQSGEVDFLQGLVNVIPQETSFIRTQRAMADEVQALRAKVGRRLRDDLHVLVDTKANKLYVKKGLQLLWPADCSVGRGGFLNDKTTGRRWEFVTPRGQFEVLGKIEKPVWIKPDWAFVENGEPIPAPADPKRQVEGELGAYVLNLGDGYLIHGTQNEALLGRPVSHGCVRLGAADLQRLYETVPRGARVYIY